MSIKTPFCILMALLLGTAALNAQTTPKYGHMNLGSLFDLLPETKKANDELKLRTDKLTAQDDSLTKNLQAQAAKLQQEYNSGTLTPVAAQTRQAELQKQQEAIQQFEENAQKEVNDFRQQLYQPILSKLEDTIKAVAKENGYQMIFDTSSGALLFFNDTDDVTALVKKKLGI